MTHPLRGYAGSMAARIGDDIWGQRTPYSAGESWPVRVDQHLIDGVTVDDVDSWVPSAVCSAAMDVDWTSPSRTDRWSESAVGPRIESITAVSGLRASTAGKDNFMID